MPARINIIMQVKIVINFSNESSVSCSFGMESLLSILDV